MAFCHVLLSPKSVTNISFGTAPKHFFFCARRFYKDMFHASPSINEQIDQAMNQDVTILFLAIPVGNKSAVPKSFLPYSILLITVSGVSFQMFCDPNDTNLMSVFLSLLGVTHHSTAHPLSIQSWQHNGVGLFMIIQVIKRCASITGVTKIELFLQCSEPSAIHFYTMIGFWPKNKGETNDGFGMLPDHVRDGLELKTPSLLLHFPIKRTKAIANRAGSPILMHLSHGGLKHLTTKKAFQKDDDVGSAVASRTLPNWCQYRPKKLTGGG